MRILTWNTKYGAKHYDANTKETLEASSRMILRELLEDGYIYEPSEAKPATPEELEALESLASIEASNVKLPKDTLEKLQRDAAAPGIREDEYRVELKEYRNLQALAAGKPVRYLAYRPARHTDAEWAERVEAIRDRIGDQMELDEAGIWLPLTAWSVIQDRSGYEYEDFALSNVISPTVEA